MDENKKNEGLNEETSEENISIDEQENEKSVEDRASEILSGLKQSVEESAIPDAVQDWDGVLPENEDELEIVEEKIHIIDEIKDEEPEEEIPEEERCVLCGKRRRCTSISEDYEYCAQCRIQMLKRPFGAMGIIATVLVSLVFIISMFVFAQNVLIGASSLMGYSIEKKGYVDAALSAYDETLLIASETGMSVPMTVVERMALLTEKAYGPLMAGDKISAYLSTYEIEKSEVLKEIVKAQELFTKTSTACQDAFANYYDNETGAIEAEKAYAALKKLYDDTSTEYDRDFILYFMSNVAAVDADVDTEIKYLEEIRKKSPEKYWLYNEGNALILGYIKKDDYDTAMKIADTVLEMNKSHQEANWVKAQYSLMNNDTAAVEDIIKALEKSNATAATAVSIKALMARLDGDYEEAINLCTEAIDNDTYNAEVYCQNLIAMLLNGDSETAYNMISEYYSYVRYNGTPDDQTKFMNAYALTAFFEDKETYEKIKAEYASNNSTLKFPEELEKFENNEISLEEIFLKGDYDLS